MATTAAKVTSSSFKSLESADRVVSAKRRPFTVVRDILRLRSGVSTNTVPFFTFSHGTVKRARKRGGKKEHRSLCVPGCSQSSRLAVIIDSNEESRSPVTKKRSDRLASVVSIFLLVRIVRKRSTPS